MGGVTFSDDDLSKLKMDLQTGGVITAYLPGLIDRLEAAEKVCKEWEKNANTSHPCSMNTLYEAWRKSAGKESR